MAQPSEARPAANAKVGTIQKWLVGVAIGCAAVGSIAYLIGEHQSHRAPYQPWPESHWIFIGIELLFFGLAWLVMYAARGLLMILWPRDVRGQLRSAVERTGCPRLYGLAMMWGAIAFLLAYGLLIIDAIQLSQNPALLQDDAALSSAAYGLFVASALPLAVLETYGWWRRHIQHRMAE